jgi:NAD(P)-dependent dehydrogenase (short-subunit alcohol dehydrogenase family)
MNNYPNFNDKVALVTGASSGIGWQPPRRLRMRVHP